MRLKNIRNNNEGNNSENDNNNDNRIKPLLKIKPRFNLFLNLSTKHLATLATLVFIGVIVVKNSSVSLLYFLLVLAVYLLYVLYKMFNLNRKYKKTAYLFFEDRLVILKKFGRQETNVILYSEIEDILYYQNYVQKLFNIGDLGIKVSGRNIFNNIVMLESVNDLYGTIEKIKGVLYE